MPQSLPDSSKNSALTSLLGLSLKSGYTELMNTISTKSSDPASRVDAELDRFENSLIAARKKRMPEPI